jgi:3-deoxy-manno-octulosonate cytidylyltransferase (CMP-KDO synthetase)
MIVRVARRVARSTRVAKVVVATDDRRIQEVAERAGLEVAWTRSDHPSGSDRVAEATAQLPGDALILNVQGDEPLIDPIDLDALLERMITNRAGMGTLARPIEPARFVDPNAVKVVVDARGRALYFSRAPIPHSAPGLALLHVGVYAYRAEVLRRLTELPPSPLEQAERLEQLRALEAGQPIEVVPARSSAPSIAIDTPEDVPRVLQALRASTQLETAGHAQG